MQSAAGEDVASVALEAAGFDASFHDTVLRRYREQDGMGSGPAVPTEADRETS